MGNIRIPFEPGNFYHVYNHANAHDNIFANNGNLFLDNLQRKEIASEDYLCKLLIYIHQNPVLHGFVSQIEDWQFSSYSAFFSTSPTSLKRNEVIAWFEDLKYLKYCHLWQLDEEFD